MQNTTNLNLKKPEYTDFADIQDINDNMDILDGALHDTQNSVATFTSSDVADGNATSWTSVTKVDSGETHKSIFAKMSQMFKNIRYLYKMLGTTDISSIGTGTVTNALSVLNAKIVFTTTGVAFSVNGSSTKYVSLSFPTNATIANADQYYWRPMTGYTSTGSLGVMELRQTSSTVADALIRNFATTTVSSSIYVVWIGNLL